MVKWKPNGEIDIDEMVVINHNSKFYLFWNILVTVCCLLSSNLYLYMAANKLTEKTASRDTIATMILFEGIFFIDMCVNFILSYEYMGQFGQTTERSIGNIASHYFWSQFLWDFIPIAPF